MVFKSTKRHHIRINISALFHCFLHTFYVDLKIYNRAWNNELKLSLRLQWFGFDLDKYLFNNDQCHRSFVFTSKIFFPFYRQSYHYIKCFNNIPYQKRRFLYQKIAVIQYQFEDQIPDQQHLAVFVHQLLLSDTSLFVVWSWLTENVQHPFKN